MSRTPRDKGPTDQKTDTTRLADPSSNADGCAMVARTNADKGREDGALVRIALRFTAWAERWYRLPKNGQGAKGPRKWHRTRRSATKKV